MSVSSINYNSAEFKANTPYWTQRFDASTNVTLTNNVTSTIIALNNTTTSSFLKGIYTVRVFFNLKGDNTTNITNLIVTLGSYQTSNTTLLLNTTLPNANDIPFGFTIFTGFFTSTINLNINSTFTGTAPQIKDAFIRIIRLS